MTGNGTDIPIIGKEAEEQTITFHFAPNGDLARIDGNVNLSQLLIVAFEATQLAVGYRAATMMQQSAMQRTLADVKDRLAKERRGTHGR